MRECLPTRANLRFPVDNFLCSDSNELSWRCALRSGGPTNDKTASSDNTKLSLAASRDAARMPLRRGQILCTRHSNLGSSFVAGRELEHRYASNAITPLRAAGVLAEPDA